jgi:hypothetical protein
MNSQYLELGMSLVSIVTAVSTTATAILIIIKMAADRRAKRDKYERAVTEGYVYGRDVNSFPDMCRSFILYSIARHSDGKSCEYGFHKVVHDYSIDNPKEFLEFVINHQPKSEDRYTFDELKFLLKLK